MAAIETLWLPAAAQVPNWPPQKTDEELDEIHKHIKDYQITHGSLLKLVRTDQEDSHSVLSRPIGVSMFPTWFPKLCFDHARSLQRVFNELYVKVAEDEVWLSDVLRGLIASDPLTQSLWYIHTMAKRDGANQPLSLGIFRSDYMLHTEPYTSPEGLPTFSLKQVEFNNYSCAGGTHANIVAGMHHHLGRIGCFDQQQEPQQGQQQQQHQQQQRQEYQRQQGQQSITQFTPNKLPPNPTINSITTALTKAHQAYSHSYPSKHSPLAILMVVQPHNVNITDERPLEYALWDSSVACFRVELLEALHSRCILSAGHILYYYPAFHPLKRYEISVVYLRAGYDAAEYTPDGISARLTLERSRAIKVPNILSHLSTFKKVQQSLSVPGALDRFLTPPQVDLISQTFAPMYPLDPSSTLGQRARQLATNPQTAINYILKPSLEGGGHNVYGAAIPEFLSTVDPARWEDFILMERIRPPESVCNILLSAREIYQGPVVSELGVFGSVLWRSPRKDGREGHVGVTKRAGEYATAGTTPDDSGVEILFNENAGWSFKTKARDVDEMSVVKGFGCFDCPFLD